MSAHTKGPWSVFSDDEIPDSTYGIDAEDGTAVVFFGFNRENGIRNIHDARLIAAAPELLEALRAMIALHDSIDPQGLFRSLEEIKASAAIAKATGAMP